MPPKLYFYSGISLWMSVLTCMLTISDPRLIILRWMAMVFIGAILFFVFMAYLYKSVERSIEKEEAKIRARLSASL